MQLRVARLCLDCDEVHDRLQCPICASETFTYLTRWVPAPENDRPAPSESSSPDAEVYRQLVSGGGAPRSRRTRLLKQGAVALTVLGVVGWWWQNGGRKDTTETPPGTGE